MLSNPAANTCHTHTRRGLGLYGLPFSCQMPPTPCVCLLMDIFARGTWLTETGLRQGWSTCQVRSSVITDALLGFNLYINHLILISPENRQIVPDLSRSMQIIHCKQPNCPKEMLRHKSRPTQSNLRHLPLSREQQQLCPTFTKPVVKGYCSQ